MAPRRAPDLDILGWTGLKQHGGSLDDEFHRALRGERGKKLLREMADNDPIVGTIIQAISTFVRQTEVHVRNDAESAAGAANMEFISQCLDDMSSSFDDTLSEIMRSMIVFGFAYIEIVYKLRDGDNADPRRNSDYDDGKVGWRKWGPRPSETIQRWKFDDDGGVKGAYQIQMNGGEVFLPIEKCLLFRTETINGNPEGRSMLRNSFTSYHYAKNLREIEAIGIERDMTGLPVLRVPPSVMASATGTREAAIRSDLEKLGQQIRRDERAFMMLPAKEYAGQETGYDFELMASPGSHSIDTDDVIRRYESRMAMPLLAEVMFLGVDGSQGLGGKLGEVKLEMFERSITALLERIAAPINDFAIPRLMRLNGQMDRAEYPRFSFGPVSRPRLAELGDFLQKTASAAVVMPDRTLENYIREQAGLPEAEDQEELADG
jgi:hypothetical protein